MELPSEEVEVELSLALSLGKKPVLTAARTASSEDLAEQNVFLRSTAAEHGEEHADLRRKRESHATLGRKRKKRDEKQLMKPICGESNGVDADEVPKTFSFGEQGRGLDTGDRAQKNPKPNPSPNPNATVDSNGNGNISPCTSFPLVSMPYPCNPAQYLPFPNGFGYPYMVPWWNMPVPAGNDGSKPGRHVFQPVAIRGSPPLQGGNGVLPVGGAGSDGETSGGKPGSIFRATSLTASQGSSFSAISDFQSGGSSSSNSSCDTKTHSNPASNDKHHLDSSFKMVDPLQQSHPIISPNQVEAPRKADAEPTDNKQISNSPQSIPRSNSTLKAEPQLDHRDETTTTPIKNKSTPLPEMPCVSTTGNGPDGKKITGFLYRYNQTEVSIVCVCHGSSFSPAEFIKHAGGTEVSHPLRHIVIVPS